MSDKSGNSRDQLVDIYLIIDPGRFHFLKFILEGYDNLALLSSIKRKEGIVQHAIEQNYCIYLALCLTCLDLEMEVFMTTP